MDKSYEQGYEDGYTAAIQALGDLMITVESDAHRHTIAAAYHKLLADKFAAQRDGNRPGKAVRGTDQPALPQS